MSKVAKVPAKKTSPVVWLGILGSVVAIYIVTTPPEAPPSNSSSTRKKKPAAAKTEGQITQADYEAYKKPFPPVGVSPVDAFNPLVKQAVKETTIKAIDLPEGTTKGVPSSLTGGEENWYVTGVPALNGVREALLENTGTGETRYLRTGDRWKSARVTGIDLATLSLVGPSGASVQVPVIQPGETPGGTKTAEIPAGAPLAIPGGTLSGAIGGTSAGGPRTLTLSNGQTLQLPLPDARGATIAPAASPDPNTRRRGRNRNRNTGTPNNGQ